VGAHKTPLLAWTADEGARKRALVDEPSLAVARQFVIGSHALPSGSSSTILSASPTRVSVKTRPALPRGHQLERSGTRSLIRSKDRPQTRRIKEGETSQVEYDPTGRGSFEDAAERIFDAGDGRQVEFA
jgi:hypothetical protein